MSGVPPQMLAREGGPALPDPPGNRTAGKLQSGEDQREGELYAANDLASRALSITTPANLTADDRPSPGNHPPGTTAGDAQSDVADPRLAEVSSEMDRVGDADADEDQLSVVTIHIDHAEGLRLVQKILVNNNVLRAEIREAEEKTDNGLELSSKTAVRVFGFFSIR